MANNFLELYINFTEENHCSVFFAHLQNTLRKMKQSIAVNNIFQIDKISHIIYDIYMEHQKLQNNYTETSKSLKEIMTEFSSVLNQCKDDREKLMETTKQKFDMLQRLKQSNDDSIILAQENEVLKKTVAQLKQINQLLVEKNQVTEQQLQNKKVADFSIEHFNRICKQYDRLLQSNTLIRKQLAQINEHTQLIKLVTQPLQIINRAFKTEPKIKDQIWTIANSGNQQLCNKQVKNEFYKFDFDEILKSIKKVNSYDFYN